MWVLLSISGAFFQALGAAVKKKSLQTSGMNNVIGLVSFLIAGAIFGFFHVSQSGTLWVADLSVRFWQGILWGAGLNIVGIWFMYRALDSAEFNHLMPFMTLTSLSMVIPPIFLLGEMPKASSLSGIALIVAGVTLINYRSGQEETASEKNRKYGNRRGVFYFMVTAACFTFTPTFAKMAIQESSVLFASCLTHLLIAFGFLLMIFSFREKDKMVGLVRDPKMRGLLGFIVASGIIVALENGSVNTALSGAPVAYVMALKRLMPFFAFLIGIIYFKERRELGKKFLAMIIMVAGAIMVTVFK